MSSMMKKFDPAFISDYVPLWFSESLDYIDPEMVEAVKQEQDCPFINHLTFFWSMYNHTAPFTMVASGEDEDENEINIDIPLVMTEAAAAGLFAFVAENMLYIAGEKERRRAVNEMMNAAAFDPTPMCGMFIDWGKRNEIERTRLRDAIQANRFIEFV